MTLGSLVTRDTEKQHVGELLKSKRMLSHLEQQVEGSHSEHE